MAIVLREPRHDELLRLIAAGAPAGVGTPTLVETGLVLTGRLGLAGRGLLAHFLAESEALPIAFGEMHWRVAHAAFVRYGRGRHEARLNFGDCLTYATAKLADQPLLALGDEFAKTDLELVA